MHDVLSTTLEEPTVMLHLEYGVGNSSEGSFPIFLEASADSIELYSKIGAVREQMLFCQRKDHHFIVTGGPLLKSIPEDEL